VNVDPLAELAERVTCVLYAKLAEHDAPQVIPLGLLVTVPLPVPLFVTVNACGPGLEAVNVAVAVTACDVVTVHCVDVP
jgi:hypothetical protein